MNKFTVRYDPVPLVCARDESDVPCDGAWHSAAVMDEHNRIIVHAESMEDPHVHVIEPGYTLSHFYVSIF